MPITRLLLIITIFGSGLSAAWPNGYLLRRTLTIDTSHVLCSYSLNSNQIFIQAPCADAANLTNFPVVALASASPAVLRSYISPPNDVQNPLGYDVIFTSDANGMNVLDFDRSVWTLTGNSFAGYAEFWVKIPTLLAGGQTVVYAFYNKSGVVVDPQNKAGVWQNNGYTAVYHFGNPAALDLTETSGNGGPTIINHGATVQINGIFGANSIGSAALQSHAYLEVPTSAATNITTTATIQIQSGSPALQGGSTYQSGISTTLSKYDGVNGYQFSFVGAGVGTPTGAYAETAKASSTSRLPTTSPNCPGAEGTCFVSNLLGHALTWDSVSGAYNYYALTGGSNNGVTNQVLPVAGRVSSGTNTNLIGSNSGALILGATQALTNWYSGPDNTWTNPAIDELQISNVVRSQYWLAVANENYFTGTANSLNGPFIIWGDAEFAPPAPTGANAQLILQ